MVVQLKLPAYATREAEPFLIGKAPEHIAAAAALGPIGSTQVFQLDNRPLPLPLPGHRLVTLSSSSKDKPRTYIYSFQPLSWNCIWSADKGRGKGNMRRGHTHTNF